MRATALLNEGERQVVPPAVDFARLPWSDGQYDHNATTPYLSASVTNPPFASDTFRLKAGVHLHWFLPAVYRRAFLRSGPGDAHAYAPAPNLWLVRRTAAGVAPMDWVVESDVVAAPTHFEHASGSYMPYPADDGTPPFRLIGRTLPLADWLVEDEVRARYPGLAAVGYGDPAFASYYPACSRCFGFHDADGLALAQPVAYEMKPFLLAVPESEREHPDRALDRLAQAPALDACDEDLRVGRPPKADALRLEIGA